LNIPQNFAECEKHGQTAPGRTLVENFPQPFKGKARDKVAMKLGLTPRIIAATTTKATIGRRPKTVEAISVVLFLLSLASQKFRYIPDFMNSIIFQMSLSLPFSSLLILSKSTILTKTFPPCFVVSSLKFPSNMTFLKKSCKK